ncbi:cell division cycle 20.2, cofactor of APC complex-like isoform X1 [Musa acuminata AAA Group]|uniref:cell division cycle 20.2, cofactor of APC complex-like isoform X1 n=1 Tax=Musa acuminata AAA Group TaxID=214697 RepID=UPI0031D2F958
MASPLMRLRDREWYSPASNELAHPGDRFIPTRCLMNLDFARSSLTERRRREPAAIDSPVILTPKDEYRRRVEENMRLDSEGKPRRMLVFRGSPRNSKPSVLLVDEMMKDQQARLRPIDRIRHVPKSADRILDGTALLDDYYLNLMDWGKNNILAVALGRSVYLWNATNNSVQLLLTAADEDDHPTSIAWSMDAKTVAVGFARSRVEIWDAIELQQQVRILEGHSARVGSLSWNQNVLTSGSHDASIINHDVRSSHHLASRLRAHSEEVCGLKWSGGGNLLASGGNDNLVHVWESSKMGSSKYLHRYSDHCAAVRALAWCPFRSSTLASGGGTADQCIKIWNTQTGKCTDSINTSAQVCALEWNRHEKEILSAHGYSQNQLSLWAYPSMTKIADLTGHTARVLHLSQSPDGCTVASAAADETIRFWKVFEHQPQRGSSKLDHEDRLFSLNRTHIR